MFSWGSFQKASWDPTAPSECCYDLKLGNCLPEESQNPVTAWFTQLFRSTGTRVSNGVQHFGYPIHVGCSMTAKVQQPCVVLNSMVYLTACTIVLWLITMDPCRIPSDSFEPQGCCAFRSSAAMCACPHLGPSVQHKLFPSCNAFQYFQ